MEALPAQAVPVTRAVGIAVPITQGSSFSLLVAAVTPLALGGQVMQVRVTARPAELTGSLWEGRRIYQFLRRITQTSSGRLRFM